MNRKLKQSVNRKRLVRESLSDVEDKAREVQNPVYADAIRGIKRADKAREEYRKLPKAEVREEKPKFKGTQNMKKMHLDESLFEGLLVETGEWEDDEEGLLWKQQLLDLVHQYTTFDSLELEDVEGFDKYQGPYVYDSGLEFWLDNENEDCLLMHDINYSVNAPAWYRICSREDFDKFEQGNLEPLQESLKEAKNPKFVGQFARKQTDDEINRFVDVFKKVLANNGFDTSNITVDRAGNDEKPGYFGVSAVVVKCPVSGLDSKRRNRQGDTVWGINNIIMHCYAQDGYSDYDSHLPQLQDRKGYGNDSFDAKQYSIYLSTDGKIKPYKKQYKYTYTLEGDNHYHYDDTIEEFENDIDSYLKGLKSTIGLSEKLMDKEIKHCSRLSKGALKESTSANTMTKFEDVTRGDDYSYEGDYIVQVYSYSDNNYDTRIEQCLDNNEAASWFDELNKMTDKELNENGISGFAWLTVDDDGTTVITDERISRYADTKAVQKEIDYFVNTKQKNESLFEDSDFTYEGDYIVTVYSYRNGSYKTYIEQCNNSHEAAAWFDELNQMTDGKLAENGISGFAWLTVDDDGTTVITDERISRYADTKAVQKEIDYFVNTKQKAKKQLKEDSEIHVFNQIPDEEIYDQADYVFSDDGLYGKDYTDGLIIGGNRDYSYFIYSREHKDEIKDLLYSGYSSDEIVQELNKITGKTYVADQISGYSQSDWNNIYYPTGEFSNDFIREIEDAYFGKYTAYDDGNELVVVFDSDRRPVKEIISDQTGIPVNQIKIRKFTGYTRTPNYEDDED